MMQHANIEEKRNSYRSILKATMLIGGSSALNMLIGMVRTKFAAILIGPAGIGLIALYSQASHLVYTASSFGLGRSGVRQVAEAVATNDDERIARTVTTLRRTVWLSGSFGMLAMFVFSGPISRITFNSSDYVFATASLGIIILLTAITSGQACILQGARRISDLAKISIISAVAGTLSSLPCFYFFGNDGIIPSLILTGCTSLAASWWFARKLKIKKINLSWTESRSEAKQMLSLGFGLMAASLVSLLSNYLIQILIVRQFNLEGAGICQAALSLSLVFVSFVLGSMGADFYPRLTAKSTDNLAMQHMINEQLGISISMALPGLALMLVFSPYVIKLFYSASFIEAIPILRWCCLGMLGRVLSWPLGFLVMAKGYGKLYFFTELVSALSRIIAVLVLTKYFGMSGVGMALVVQNVSYTVLMLFVMKNIIGSTLSHEIAVQSLISIASLSAIMINIEFNTNTASSLIFNIIILFVIILSCSKNILKNSDISIKKLIPEKFF